MTKPPASPNTTRNSGYGKPPQEHRFKPGVSGNPHGRPRKSHADTGGTRSALADLISEQMNKPISVTENGQVRTVTGLAAVIQVMTRVALKGNVHAARLLLGHVASVEQGRQRKQQQRYDRQDAYKWRATAAIRKCEEIGLLQPNFVPHPDDMQVDSARGVVTIHGPANTVEKMEWNTAEAKRQELIKSTADLRKVLAGPENGLKAYGSRVFVFKRLAMIQDQLAELDANYPSEEQRRKPGYIHKPCPNQEAKDVKRTVTRPATDSVRPADDKQMAVRDIESLLKQSDDAIKLFADELASCGDPPTPRVGGGADKVCKSERNRSARELAKLIAERESNLSGMKSEGVDDG